jgi:hypothetical protein
MQEQIRKKKEEDFAEKSGDPFYGIDVEMDPNDMPDSIEKYKTIVLRARNGHGKFVDTNFT